MARSIGEMRGGASPSGCHLGVFSPGVPRRGDPEWTGPPELAQKRVENSATGNLREGLSEAVIFEVSMREES